MSTTPNNNHEWNIIIATNIKSLTNIEVCLNTVRKGAQPWGKQFWIVLLIVARKIKQTKVEAKLRHWMLLILKCKYNATKLWFELVECN